MSGLVALTNPSVSLTMDGTPISLERSFLCLGQSTSSRR